MYKIEKDISQNTNEKAELRVIMETMEIGDSFFMETVKESGSARNYGQCIRKKKFSIKKWKTGFRCWRIL